MSKKARQIQDKHSFGLTSSSRSYIILALEDMQRAFDEPWGQHKEWNSGAIYNQLSEPKKRRRLPYFEERVDRKLKIPLQAPQENANEHFTFPVIIWIKFEVITMSNFHLEK